jgi:hypothetical protein
MNIRSTLTVLLTFFILSGIFAQQKDFSRIMLEFIPADAVFVANIKSNAIESKMSWENIFKLSVCEELVTQVGKSFQINDSRFFLEIIQNPTSKGIEFPGELMAFGETVSEQKFINMMLPLSDAALFKNELSKYFGPGFNNSIVIKGQQLTFIHNGRVAVSWNKNIAILTIMLPNFYNYTLEENENELRISLDNYLDKIHSSDAYENMLNNNLFYSWYGKVRDAGIWVDYKEIMRLYLENSLGSAQLPGIASNLLEILINSYGEMSLASDISFEKGKILSDTYIYAGKDLIDFSKSATSNRANKKMLKYIDGQKTGIYMTMATSPKGVYEGWKKFLGEKAGGFKASVEDLFGFMEIFIDEKDAFNFLKGDLFYAVNGLKTVERISTEYEYDEETDEYIPVESKKKEQIPLLTAGFSYGKKEQMLKLIRVVQRTGLLKKINNKLYQLSLPTFNEPIYVKLDNGLMVLSNDEQRMKENKRYRALPKKHSQFMKSDFQTLYLNTSAITDIILGSNPPNDARQILKNIKDGVGDMTLHSRRPKKKDNCITQNFVLDLKNKEENALKQLLDFAERIYISSMKGL